MSIRYVYNALFYEPDMPPFEGHQNFEEPQDLHVFHEVASAGYGYELISLHSIIETIPGSGFRFLWRSNWFFYFMPDDHAPAVQRLSELGLGEYAMDLIRQARDAGFIEDASCSEPLRL